MININLLSPQLKLKRMEAKRNASLISLCIVIVLAFAILGVISRSLKSTVETSLSATKSDVDKGLAQLDQYKDLQDLALLINDRGGTAEAISKNRVIWSQVLQELANDTPSDVQFESLIADASKSPNFILKGNTTTEREIIKFKEKLENSQFFKNVTFKSSSLNQNQTTEQGKLSFTLDFDLEQKSITGAVSSSSQKEIK